MSTRCQIAFYYDITDALDEPAAMIYRHSDGYPATEYGVIADLVPALQSFREKRGFWDAEYTARSVLCTLATVDGLCYGVSQKLHGDIDYFYAVYDRRIAVYAAGSAPAFETMGWLSEEAW